MTAYLPVTVRAVKQLTPRTIRVTVGGEALSGLESDGEPDEYCRVVFPAPGTSIPELPGEEELSPEDAIGRSIRLYTVRRFDRDTCELDLDIVLHGGGIGATWAGRARVGDALALGHPHGSYDPPPDTDWQLLVGDATSLPAIARITESLRPGTPARVVVVVPDAAEEQPLASAGDVDVRWVHVPDPRAVGAAITSALRGFEHPAGRGYIWVCGENAAARLCRKHLRHELGWPAARYHTLGYWRLDEEDWIARYKLVAAELEARIEAEEGQHSDDEEFVDAVLALYDEFGLGW